MTTQRRTQEATATAIGGVVASSKFEQMIHDAYAEVEAGIKQRYAEAKICECGSRVEEIDQGGVAYWAHVDRMRIEYGHAAVPLKPEPR
jgi:hypothetical protein